MKLVGLLATLISLARHLAVILLVLSGIVLVLSPWVDPPRIEIGFAVPAAFRLDPEREPVAIPPDRADNVRLEGANGSLFFSPRNRGLVAATAVVMILVFAVLAWVLGQLRGLFHTLRAGRPFALANATRIRRIAYAVIGAELVRSLVVYAGTRYTMSTFALQGVRFEARLDVDFFTIIYGLMFLVIAEAFREGARLAEEQSLTI